MIRAKRDSDQALTACRNRIDELQNECRNNREAAESLATTKEGLEQEIQGHHSRISSLDRSKAAVEYTLRSTIAQLQLTVDSEEKLKQQLQKRDEEIAGLEHSTKDKQNAIATLQSEKEHLEESLEYRNVEFHQLEICTTALTDTTQSLQSQLKAAEQHEDVLRDRLAEKEGAREDLRKRLDRGSQDLKLLQQQLQAYERESLEHVKTIQVNDTVVATLQAQLRRSEHDQKNTENALATLKTEVALIQANWQADCDARDQLTAELACSQTARADIQEELRATEECLENEIIAKNVLYDELETLRSSYDTANVKLQAAQERILSLEEVDISTQAKLEILRDGKAALEADLRDARQSLFRLREDVNMMTSELAEVHLVESELQRKLQQSEERASSLEMDLEQAHAAAMAAKIAYNADLERSNAQLTELESSMLELQTALASSEGLKRSLEAQLNQAQACRNFAAVQLDKALDTQVTLKIEVENIRPRLGSVECDRDSLQNQVNELASQLAANRERRSQLEKDLATASNERNDLRISVSELKTALETNCDAKDEIAMALATAQVDGETSEAKINDLYDQLQNVEMARETAELRLRDALNSQTVLEKDYHESRSRLSMLEADLTRVQSQLSNAHETAALLERTKQEAEQHLDVVRQSYNELVERSKSLEARFPIVELEVKELGSRLSLAEEELEALYRNKAAVERQLTENMDANASLHNELDFTRQSKSNIESRLNSVLDTNLRLEEELSLVRSKADAAKADNVHVTSELSQTVKALRNLQGLKDGVERRLEDVLIISSNLEKDLSMSRSQVSQAELQNATLATRLSEANQELDTIRHAKARLEERAKDAENNVSSFEEEASTLQLLLSEVESNRDSLALQLSTCKLELEQYRDVHVHLEENLQVTSRRAGQLESELREAGKQLDIAKQEALEANHRTRDANKEIEYLRESNATLEGYDKDLTTRLVSAEEDLSAVRETNERLEAFLERVKVDMVAAEAAVAESEKRLEQFVEESQAKMDATKLAKMKYKRMLSLRNNELEILLTENSQLHQQVGEQIQELGNLKRGKEKLAQDLSDREKYIVELGSSSERRLKFMHSAYNDLRKKHENMENMSRSTRPSESESGNDEYAACIAQLEEKVRALEEDKRAFKRLVRTLKEKTRGLEVLEEWQEGGDTDEHDNPRHIRILEVPQRSATSSPITPRNASSTRGSIRSQPASIEQSTVLNFRPATRASNASQDENLENWAQEVERVRMLRNETAVRLKGLKKSKHDLKKSLKDTEAYLYRLEKQQSP